MPNAFRPNGDKEHEILYPFSAQEVVETVRFKVYTDGACKCSGMEHSRLMPQSKGRTALVATHRYPWAYMPISFKYAIWAAKWLPTQETWYCCDDLTFVCSLLVNNHNFLC